MKFQWDEWQKQVMNTKGNMCICSPRQMGKSTVISQDAGEFAVKNKNKVIMIIASVERQALLLFEKVLSYIYNNYKSYIKKGKDKPTKHKLQLNNGSVIHCLPTGDSGYGIRGFTIDRLYADEAAFIGEDVWAAVTPMLATTGGDIILLSTPMGTDGYFYRAFNSKQFTSIHVDPEKVIAGRPEPQRTRMLEFRKDEKERMTKLQFQQEHLGLFVGGIQRFFPDRLINEVLKLPTTNSGAATVHRGDLFQGVDIAAMGSDDSVFVTLERRYGKLIQRDLEITNHERLTATTRLIIHKDKRFNHKRIYIDDGGLGVGVFDALLEDPQTKRKVVGINNARRSIEWQRDPKKKPLRVPLLKEDLYNNLKKIMENGNIQLFDSPEVRQSLRSIQYEITDGKLKIYGNYSHITEALIRAAWCQKDKHLNPYIS